MNKQIAQLQEFSKNRDENSQHAKKHSSSVVVSLQSKLANMSKSFKQVLEIRTGALLLLLLLLFQSGKSWLMFCQAFREEIYVAEVHVLLQTKYNKIILSLYFFDLPNFSQSVRSQRI